jgi:hypothetical protein
MAWEDWIQDIAGSVIKDASAAKFTQPYEVARLQLQALGQQGVYNEGQPGTKPAQAGAGLPTGTLILLLGGALLFVLMKD